MKKVKVAKKYGEWFYEKETSHDLEFPIYHVYNEDKSEKYTVCIYHQILELVKEPTKQDREKYIQIYG